MAYTSIGIISLIVHIIVNYDVFKKSTGTYDVPAKKSYRRFLVAVLLFYVADSFWGTLYELRMVWPVYVDTVLFFLSMAVSVFFWTRYIIDYLNKEGAFKEILSAVGWLFLTVEAVFLIMNFFFPVMFRFDENGEYCTSDGRYITLIVQVVLYSVTAIYTLAVSLRSEGKQRLRHRTICLSGLAMAAFIAVQAADPFLPLYSVGCLVATCLLHTFVVEDEKEEYRKELEYLIQKEKKQKEELGSAKHMAYTDSLTGVKNKHAYAEMTAEIDRRIEEGEIKRFGVIVFDLNGLKKINDTRGHEVGDDYIKAACSLICSEFKRSPVYRIGGDEFVAFLEGEDYRERQLLLKEFDLQIERNLHEGKVIVASGMDVFEPMRNSDYRSVFEAADRKMYERKHLLKTME